MVWCRGFLAASADVWLCFLAGKRTPATLQEASRKEPEASQGEPTIVTVTNLQDRTVLEEGKVTGPVTGPEVEA